LVGQKYGDNEIWYCFNDNNNKYYKIGIKRNETVITEIIEEITEESMNKYVSENLDSIADAFKMEGIEIQEIN
jgi:hypothetical protein